MSTQLMEASSVTYSASSSGDSLLLMETHRNKEFVLKLLADENGT